MRPNARIWQGCQEVIFLDINMPMKWTLGKFLEISVKISKAHSTIKGVLLKFLNRF